MLNFILPILKNPLTRMVSSKIIGGIQHKMEKDKIIRAREIEATKTIAVEQIRQQENSLKDEWLVVFFTILMGLHFWPPAQNAMERGWTILQKADPMFWYIILTIVGASFGVTTMNKFKKK